MVSLDGIIEQIFRSYAFNVASNSTEERYLLVSKGNIDLSIGYSIGSETVSKRDLMQFLVLAGNDDADRKIFITTAGIPSEVRKFADEEDVQCWNKERFEREIGRAILAVIEEEKTQHRALFDDYLTSGEQGAPGVEQRTTAQEEEALESAEATEATEAAEAAVSGAEQAGGAATIAKPSVETTVSKPAVGAKTTSEPQSAQQEQPPAQESRSAGAQRILDALGPHDEPPLRKGVEVDHHTDALILGADSVKRPETVERAKVATTTEPEAESTPFALPLGPKPSDAADVTEKQSEEARHSKPPTPIIGHDEEEREAPHAATAPQLKPEEMPNTVLEPRVGSDEANRIAKKIVDVVRADLELIPYYVFDYNCEVPNEQGEMERHAGTVGVNGLTLDAEKWPQEFTTIEHVEEKSRKIIPQHSSDEAMQTAREAIIQANTKVVERKMERDSATIIEKKEMKPRAEAMDIALRSVLYNPVWCVEGSNGIMIISAANGHVVREDLFKSAE